MFDHRFFASQLGHAALVSILAMVAFTVVASAQPPALSAEPLLVGAPMVELA